ncbi:growth-regulating factor 1-like isoform X2 [Quercus lobata]|uniref:growth-regulating factor 1-like isoform X2 n=1 Tax=Quercus lobata TaxID=97700 RepID=UPI001248400B|nr:growth-regulating factor 1-like isoform X2 [Quercus lobata]
MSGRNRFPFSASQWQELEHQALIFKYMASGIPIPPDLLYTIKRSCLDSSLSSKFFPHQPHQHVGLGWNCLQMGLGRKIDPEPGRCRRTDGKKWRCSKEAFPDSKYCERHMHRGKNRSRKPVEVLKTTTTTSPSSTTTNPSTSTISSITKNHSAALTPTSHYPNPFSSLSSMSSSDTHHSHLHHSYYTNSNPPHHHFLYHNPTSSSRTPGIGLSPHDNNTTPLLLESSPYSQTNTDFRNRYIYGLKEEVDEHAFFSEPSGTMRSLSGPLSMDDPWQLTPLTMSTSSSKQRSCSGLQNQSDYSSYLQLQSLSDSTTKQSEGDQHFFVLGSDIKLMEKEQPQPQKTIHHFFDEWPPKERDSWVDQLDDKSSNSSSVSTTRLSISIPNSSHHDFPIFSSRTHNDG